MSNSLSSRLEKDNSHSEDHISHLKNIHNLDETYIQNRYSVIEKVTIIKAKCISL